jgi:hypothetical protein
MRNLKNKLEEEYKTNFVDKEKSMQYKFKEEVEKLSHQYFEIKTFNF